MSEHQLRSSKEKSLQDLHKVQLKPTLFKSTIYTFQQEAHHNVHSTKGPMSLAQRIHPALKEKIHELVTKVVVQTVKSNVHFKST